MKFHDYYYPSVYIRGRFQISFPDAFFSSSFSPFLSSNPNFSFSSFCDFNSPQLRNYFHHYQFKHLSVFSVPWSIEVSIDLHRSESLKLRSMESWELVITWGIWAKRSSNWAVTWEQGFVSTQAGFEWKVLSRSGSERF